MCQADVIWEEIHEQVTTNAEQGFAAQRVVRILSALFCRHEARFFEDAQVVRDFGLR